MKNGFLYGVCYYPEAWPARRHADDIARIADAGFNVVRMGESAWSTWEPREGQYQFDLFDSVIDLCRKHGMKVILGTPTYCGPAWIAQRYPEVLRWDFHRRPMRHGSRRSYNYTAPAYLELSDRICNALARHYRGEKQVIAWQLDNEFNCHMDVSYALSDTVSFRAWLRDRYKTLDKLNDVWGTRFWSQTYDAWDQIDLPAPTATYHNPHQVLDETRFISDCVVAFARRQAKILRAQKPQWVITHNALFANIDGPKLTAELDFISNDHYPLFADRWSDAQYGPQQIRSLSFPHWVLEQQSGPGGQMKYLHRTPRPGELRQWAMQSVAHGASGVLYFRWRTCPFGSEQHWHGLLDPDNRDTRRLDEARQFGKDIAKVPGVFFETPPTKGIGILRDFDNEANDRRINTYAPTVSTEIQTWSRVAAEAHLPADQVWSSANFTPYKLLIAPHPRMVSPTLAEKLRKYVTAGGVLVLGGQSGWYDANLHVVDKPLPGLLRSLTGVEVADWTTLRPEETRMVKWIDGTPMDLQTWVERLKPLTATPLAHWTGTDPLLGQSPALTVNVVGKGSVFYIAGYCPLAAVQALLPRIAAAAGVSSAVQASAAVEAVERTSGRRKYLVLINHSDQPEPVAGVGGYSLITGDARPADAMLTLPPHGIVLMEK